MNKLTTVIGISFALFFLVGLATTLTRSMMITFLDVLPVYISVSYTHLTLPTKA
mgnify:CR=1 FL=1